MNNTNVNFAIQNGRVVRIGEIAFKDGLGRFLKINRFSSLTSEEISALTEKFGTDVCSEFLATDSEVVSKNREAVLLENRRSFDSRISTIKPRRERDTDGDGFLSGLANCVGL